MTLDDVPADMMLSLTGELDRLFRAARCRPTCHSCWKPIGVGTDFQLLSFRGFDKMVCGKKTCNRESLEKLYQEELASKARAEMKSGYSRPSKRTI